MLSQLKALVPSVSCSNRTFISSARILIFLILLAVPFKLYPRTTPPKISKRVSHKPHFKPLWYRLNTTGAVYRSSQTSYNFTIIPNRRFLGQDVTKTFNLTPENLRIFKREDHIFIPNYVKASSSFLYNESITFTTHGEFNFLDNLVPIVERWRGPVSIAVFAPGNDFSEAVKRIRYLRFCSSKLIKQLVTFHIYVPADLVNVTMIKPWNGTNVKCPRRPPRFRERGPSYRQSKKLMYPVNVLRNFARTQARTHYVMAADIELYPSPAIIPRLMRFVESQRRVLNKSAYVLPVFEIDKSLTLPNSKTQLVKALRANKSAPFHITLCGYCHQIPRYEKWLNWTGTKGLLKPILWTTREGMFEWEPVYIGTNADPLFHEELTWEGTRNKMTQAYEMCLQGYSYGILDNAFLIHRPGIKKIGRNRFFYRERIFQGHRIDAIRRRLIKKYGDRPGCLLTPPL